MTMTSLLWRHLYLEHSQSVQYFAHAAVFFYNSQVLNSNASYKNREQVQQANFFKVKRYFFIFSTYRKNYWNIYHITRWSNCIRESTPVIVASVVKTARDPVVPHQQYVLDLEQTLILHQTYCWSRKTLVTIHWTHLRLNGTCAKFLACRKRITERCSLWDALSGNAAISNEYKWRHSDVIVIKLTAGTQN